MGRDALSRVGQHVEVHDLDPRRGRRRAAISISSTASQVEHQRQPQRVQRRRRRRLASWPERNSTPVRTRPTVERSSVPPTSRRLMTPRGRGSAAAVGSGSRRRSYSVAPARMIAASSRRPGGVELLDRHGQRRAPVRMLVDACRAGSDGTVRRRRPRASRRPGRCRCGRAPRCAPHQARLGRPARRVGVGSSADRRRRQPRRARRRRRRSRRRRRGRLPTGAWRGRRRPGRSRARRRSAGRGWSATPGWWRATAAAGRRRTSRCGSRTRHARTAPGGPRPRPCPGPRRPARAGAGRLHDRQVQQLGAPVVHVAAVAASPPDGDPEQPEQPHHVVDPQRGAVAEDAPQGVEPRSVGRRAQLPRHVGRQTPVLAVRG